MDAPHAIEKRRGRGLLEHKAACAGTDHRDDVLGCVGDREREEAHPRPTREDRPDHGLPTAARHVDVDEHDVGLALEDHVDGRVDLGRLADHLRAVAELGPHPTAEQVVVVDQEDAGSPQPSLWCHAGRS